MTTILGIDPGLDGGLAWLDTTGTLAVVDMPVLAIERGGKSKREIDAAGLAELICQHRPDCAIVERVGAMPGQGVSSMFSFGRSAGVVEGVLAALSVPATFTPPATWKRALKIQAGKDGARLRASQLLPAGSGHWRLAKHDGRAEAALLALWGLTYAPRIEAMAA
jgi:crossover junction endodeoxyribonuclease RuvC